MNVGYSKNRNIDGNTLQKSSINFAAKLGAAFAYSADGELLCDDKFLVGAVIFHSTAK